MDKASLKQYLDLLGHDKFTIQVLLDQNREPASINTAHFKSKKFVQDKYPGAEHSKTSHAFSKAELLSKDMRAELIQAQKTGRAVWVMVNEGDGKLALPESPNCVATKNVKRLSACFIDTDNCPWNTVKEYLKEIGCMPQLVVESSPKKYHLYFLLEDTELTDKNKERWKAVQKSLCHLSDPNNKSTGLDYSMHDLSKVLRLPGFHHLKAAPFLIRIKKHNDIERYSLDELYARTHAEQFLKEPTQFSDHRYEIPEQKVDKGQRHQAITEYISSRSNFITKQDLLYSVYGFILRKIKEPALFLNGGERNHEVIAAVKYYISQREQEERQQSKEQAIATLDRPETDPFSLSKEFYYSAPGLTGQIVKHICERSLYPCPAFTFATTLSALGTLKAGSITTEFGHAPVQYFLCLGPSGVGKDYAQEVFAATFSKLGISTLMEQKIRSDRGIIRFLAANNSTGMLMLDEGEGFLSSLYNKEAPAYLRQCKELLLTLFSSNNYAERSFGHVGSSKEEVTVLNYPRLNAISYGVLHTLDKAFSKETIKDGLLQRFLVVTHFAARKLNPNFKRARSLPDELLEQLRNIVTSSRSLREKTLLTIQDLESEIENEESEPRKKKLQIRLTKFLKDNFNKPSKVLKFDDAANRIWHAYIARMDALYNAEIKKESALEGLYTRAAEQVGRMSAILAGEIVTARDIEYSIEFIDSRVTALKTYCEENFDRGELGRDVDQLKRFIASRISMNGKSAITFRDIVRGFKVRDMRQLKDLLSTAEDAGDIKKLENYTSSKTGHGRRGTAYMLLE